MQGTLIASLVQRFRVADPMPPSERPQIDRELFFWLVEAKEKEQGRNRISHTTVADEVAMNATTRLDEDTAMRAPAVRPRCTAVTGSLDAAARLDEYANNLLSKCDALLGDYRKDHAAPMPLPAHSVPTIIPTDISLEGIVWTALSADGGSSTTRIQENCRGSGEFSVDTESIAGEELSLTQIAPARTSMSSDVMSTSTGGALRGRRSGGAAVSSYLYVSSSSEGELKNPSEVVDTLTEADVAAFLHDQVVYLLWARLCAVRHKIANA